MNGAISESTFNFFFKLNYNKTFASILSTPLSPGDIALGRAGLGAHPRRALRHRVHGRHGRARAGRLAVGHPRRARPRCWSGSRSGRSGWRATSFMRTWQDFDLIQLVVLPMFLFSGTFYPIDAYPEALRVLVQLTPLYQGVDLHPVAGGRGDLAGPAGPRRVPRDHGRRRAGRRLAPARQAAAQVGGRRRDGPRRRSPR